MEALKPFPNHPGRSENARIPISNNFILLSYLSRYGFWSYNALWNTTLALKALLRADTITWPLNDSTMTLKASNVIPINWSGHNSSRFCRNNLSTHNHGILNNCFSCWFEYYASRWYNALLCAGFTHYVRNRFI